MSSMELPPGGVPALPSDSPATPALPPATTPPATPASGPPGPPASTPLPQAAAPMWAAPPPAAPASQLAQPASGASPAGAVGMLSPDGLWRWDGSRWQPTLAPTARYHGVWRPLQTPGMLAIAGLGLWIVVALGAVVAMMRRISLVNDLLAGRPLVPDEANASDQMVQVLAGALVVVYLLCGVAFLVWLQRVVSNNITLGAVELQHSPRWAVGWWFVPFVNLVRPFQVVREAWNAADPVQGQTRASRALVAMPVFLPLWWLFLLAGIIADRVAAAGDGNTLRGIHDASQVELLSLALRIISAGLAIVLVHTLTQRQERRRRSLESPATAVAVPATS